MRRFLLTTSFILCAAATANAQRISPFTEVRHPTKDAVVVRFEQKLHELISMDEQPTKDVLDFCRETYGINWEKRFDEDLPMVLKAMGREVGDTVRLELRDPESKKSVSIRAAKMTRENRQLLYAARHLRKRPEASRAPRKLAAQPAPAVSLPVTLDRFHQALKQRWSYYKAGGDIDGAIANLRQRLAKEPGMPTNTFAMELDTIIATGIDGHAGVRGYRLKSGRLPFLIEPIGDRYVAFLPDRSRFLDPKHPFVTTLDGLAVEEWFKPMLPLIVNGSPQNVKRQSLRLLRDINHWRDQLELKQNRVVAVGLTSADKSTARELSETIDSRRPTYGTWPRTETKTLGSNIGYLRIKSMNSSAAGEIRDWMSKWRDTDGLVVDVRDNGGGSRHALLALSEYLLGEKDEPRVINAAKYRLFSDFGSDHLENRFMYRKDSKRWSAGDRKAIASFVTKFKPQWEPPESEFSDWHYLVLSSGAAKPDVYHYSKPVVVLMNEKCFSATDIFLAGMKELPNVALIGRPSGGGSARTTSVSVAPGIDLRIGSMASFQVDGKLFDGNGVLPDVHLEPEPGYFVGKTDRTLKAAIQTIKGN